MVGLSEILKSDLQKVHSKQIYALIFRLCIPAIMMQMASFTMQYIDTAMVGNLGASASAAVSVVFSSIFIAMSLGFALIMGFSVQVAHAIGANNTFQAQRVFREGLLICGIVSGFVSAIGIYLSSRLPALLGADPEIWHDASSYFFVHACFFPIMQLRLFSASVLQCAGNTKTPGILNTLLCLLDVIFNYFMIFPTHEVNIGEFALHIPGANLGVTGAALGTAFSEIIIATLMFLKAFKQPKLHFVFSHEKFSKNVLKNAVKISYPMVIEGVVLHGTYIFTTYLVAPFGTIALAANIFGVTVERVCCFLGIGISIASTTLVGQALGAHRKDLAHRFAWGAVKFGILIETMVAIALYVFSPFIFACLTPDVTVQELGVKVLRIQLWVEPLFEASIIIGGILRGAKDTLSASVITLVCKCFVLIPLAVLLAKTYGLVGIWIAFCADSGTRGILLLLRLKHEKSWIK